MPRAIRRAGARAGDAFGPVSGFPTENGPVSGYAEYPSFDIREIRPAKYAAFMRAGGDPFRRRCPCDHSRNVWGSPQPDKLTTTIRGLKYPLKWVRRRRCIMTAFEARGRLFLEGKNLGEVGVRR